MASPGTAVHAHQRSFDELGTPLYDVTFCVLDLETTGGSPTDCAITEVGAVRIQGGVCTGTFHTLVNPGGPIPPSITVLTGITEAMVLPAPRIHEVMPSLLEFLQGTVIVGHNVRFDLSFLNAALAQREKPKLANKAVDTLGLARRLVRDEVPNCQLGTLARQLRLDHQPSHRALDDALATADLLHVLLERAGTLGVTGLDDLLVLPTMSGHAQANKLKLTQQLPRSPGVYLFRDRHGTVLYVGKATNLRAQVRSYFSTDDRRKIGQLLRETASVDHQVCTTTLEAAVLEVRLIHALLPRFNRQAKNWKKYCYLKLTTNEAFPRLSIVRSTKPDGGIYVGPLPSSSMAQLAIEAIHTAVPLRRCTERLSGKAGRQVVRESPCSSAQLGVATCPCSGGVSPEHYATLVDQVIRGLTNEPAILFEPLRRRMAQLAEAERFEEAAATRDRAEALAQSLRRQRRFDQLLTADRLVLELPKSGVVELRNGRLTAIGRTPIAPSSAGPPSVQVPGLQLGAVDASPRLDPWMPAVSADASADADPAPPPADRPVPRELADELLAVAGWLDRNHHRLRLLACDGVFASSACALPRFQPTPVR